MSAETRAEAVRREINALYQDECGKGDIETAADIAHNAVAELEAENVRLREACEAFMFRTGELPHGDRIGWLILRPNADKHRGGVNFTVTEPEMLDALEQWKQDVTAALSGKGGGDDSVDH